MKKYVYLYCIVAVMIGFSLLGRIRPIERISSIQTSDDKHIHQIYAGHPIKTQFISEAQGLSAISIERKKSMTPESSIIAQIYTNKNVKINSSLTISDTEIRLSFEPQVQSKYQQFTVTIDAQEARKQQALLLPYESDTTKYPNNTVWQNEVKKQGSLGITEYEKPTIAVLLTRWLALPHQRPLWVGALLTCLGFALRRTPSRLPAGQAGVGPWKAVTYYLAIFFSIIITYWPATKLFFYSDDVPILARIEVLKRENPKLLFLPYQYTEADQRSKFGFDFYRPVSFTAYPLLLSFLPGTPNASVYYACNLILFALTGCLVFTIANYIARSNPAALFATAIWAFSSSKLGLLYWWSSSQDILASLFAMATIVLYMQSKKRLSLICFLLGIFSKEYVIITPLIITGIELLQGTSIKNSVRSLYGFIIATGAFLIINTAMLGNPFITQSNAANTYALTLHPIEIVRNSIVYASASAESRLWPIGATSNQIEQQIFSTLQLWRVKTAGPYYPGIVLITGALACIVFFWRKKQTRNSILFGIYWWILYLGPILLFANDWKNRWLTLAVMGTGLIVTAILRELRTPKILFVAGSICIAIYGFTIARNLQLTRFYREQSEYTKTAYSQLQEQQKIIQNPHHIILTGITPDQQTSLNAYLFRVYAKNPQTDIIYSDSGRSEDIIINMSGISPYYPESEK